MQLLQAFRLGLYGAHTSCSKADEVAGNGRERHTHRYRMPHGRTAVTAIRRRRGVPKLIGSFLVYPVGVSLIDVHQEHQVVSKDTEAVQPWHLDDKGKQVINDGVQELEGHLTPR